jgi:tetratricopeptide (TPR) repeat protein
MHGERAREHAAQLALHFEAAGDDLDAARWHRVAARSAVRWDPVQAFGHWRRVLSCAARCDASDEEAARLRLLASEAIVRLGFHHGLPRDEAERLVQDGVRLAARLGDRRAEVLLLSADGALRAASGEIAAAIDLQARAVELAEQGGDAELAMLVGARLVLTLRGAGRLREAARRADALLAAHRSAPIAAPTPGLFAVRQLELARVVTLLDLGQLDTGAAELTRIIAALREENAPLVLAWALSLTAGVIRHTGDAAPALVARVEEARTIAQQLGVPSAIGRALTTIATVRLFEQRWSETIACAEEALDLMRDVGHPNYFDPDPRLLLSYARYASGDVAGARAAAHDALQHAFTSGAVLGQIDALLAYGRLLVRYGSAAEVEAGRRMLRHGLALVHRCRARSREPVFWFELAGVARRAGDLRRALANQRRGGRLFVAMNAFGHLRRSAALMDTPAQPERRSGD